MTIKISVTAAGREFELTPDEARALYDELRKHFDVPRLFVDVAAGRMHSVHMGRITSMDLDGNPIEAKDNPPELTKLLFDNIAELY